MRHRTLPLVLGVLLLTIAIVGLGCSGQPTTNTQPPTAAPATETTRATPVDGQTASVPKAEPVRLWPAGETPDAALSESVDGYVAIAPRELRPGQTGSVSVSLFDGDLPAQGIVRVSLHSGGSQAATASGMIIGAGSILLPVPDLPPDNYRLTVEGPGFSDETSLRVEPGGSLFLETDKPIYKPGQRVMIRVLTVGPELRPLTHDVTVEVQDAKGSKVFKQTVTPGRVRHGHAGHAPLQRAEPGSLEDNRPIRRVQRRTGRQG